MRGLKPPQRRPKNASAFAAQVRVVAPPVDLSAYATTEYVDDAVAAGGGGGAWSPLDGKTVAYWPLDEAVATGAGCAPGGYGLSFVGPPGVDNAGPSGKGARSFATGTSHFESPASFVDWTWLAAGLGSWTIEGWAKLLGTGTLANCVIYIGPISYASGPTLCRVVLGKATGTAPGTVNVQWGNSTGSINVNQSAGMPLPLDAWGHFAARKTHDRTTGTAAVDLFVNGALQQSFAGLAECPTYSGSVLASVGYSVPDAGASVGFDGSLARLRFSRGPRTDQEIADFYTYSPTLG